MAHSYFLHQQNKYQQTPTDKRRWCAVDRLAGTRPLCSVSELPAAGEVTAVVFLDDLWVLLRWLADEAWWLEDEVDEDAADWLEATAAVEAGTDAEAGERAGVHSAGFIEASDKLQVMQ